MPSQSIFRRTLILNSSLYVFNFPFFLFYLMWKIQSTKININKFSLTICERAKICFLFSPLYLIFKTFSPFSPVITILKIDQKFMKAHHKREAELNKKKLFSPTCLWFEWDYLHEGKTFNILWKFFKFVFFTRTKVKKKTLKSNAEQRSLKRKRWKLKLLQRNKLNEIKRLKIE